MKLKRKASNYFLRNITLLVYIFFKLNTRLSVTCCNDAVPNHRMSRAYLSWFSVSVHALFTVPVQLPKAVVTQSSKCTPWAALITGDLYPQHYTCQDSYSKAPVPSSTCRFQNWCVCQSGKMYALLLAEVPELVGFSVLLWCYEP